jgi:3-methyl-2-oxobutanoate hydroxymethyltransferase
VSTKKVTAPSIRARKGGEVPITMLTCYDHSFATILDRTELDILLVGDSLGMVIQGHPNSLPVTMDDMVYHCRLVSRGSTRALVVADMPFLSFQISSEEAVRNAGRLIQEGGAEAVKLEGGAAVLDRISAITGAGIPVMAHLGLTPQSIHQMGGFKIQREEERLIEEARAIDTTQAFALVLEGIPGPVASRITREVKIPTIGIGAGSGCDGQVLVLHDVLGLYHGRSPRFAKRFANLAELATSAVEAFVNEVRKGEFPGEEHTYL